MTSHVAVVGAGMSGAACALALHEAGVGVTVLDRGRAPGGRMASPSLHGRRVDLGAAYFTARDAGFGSLVEDWVDRGLARPWTDTITVFNGGERSAKSGPQRYATSGGLRSLVRDLLERLPAGTVRLESTVESLSDLEHDAVVLAMPDLQAARLAPDAAEWVGSEPVVTVAAGWAERCWDPLDVAFVNDDPDLTLVADDGARRGDGAPVLAAHTTPERARRHLQDPDGAVDPAVTAMRRLLAIAEPPLWTRAHRWTFAKPEGTHGDRPYALVEHDGRPLGLANDSWCPEGAPRIESGWLSGTRLGRELARRLG